MPFNPTLQIVHGSIETIDVLIRDNQGIVTTLSGTTPTYTVVGVDPATGLDNATVYYNAHAANNNGMILEAQIDTTTGGAGGGGGGAWALGWYRMYVGFTAAGDTPKLGPFDFYVI